MLTALEQSGNSALYWAAWHGDVNMVQMLIDHGAAVDLGRTNHDYLLTCGWSFGCSFIIIHASVTFHSCTAPQDTDSWQHV